MALFLEKTRRGGVKSGWSFGEIGNLSRSYRYSRVRIPVRLRRRLRRFRELAYGGSDLLTQLTQGRAQRGNRCGRIVSSALPFCRRSSQESRWL